MIDLQKLQKMEIEKLAFSLYTKPLNTVVQLHAAKLMFFIIY